MSALLALIPIALGFGILALIVFMWSLKNGQYEDLDGAAARILIDDEDSPRAPEDVKTSKDAARDV